MSGVDGAVKLNSFRAPSTLNPETVETVSEFVVQEEKIEEIIEEPIEEPIEETVEEPIEDPIEESTEETVEEPIEDEIVKENLEPQAVEKVEEKPKRNKKKLEPDIETLFYIVENVVKKMYMKVFSKTPEFKPSFEMVMGDIILYLSNKLSLKNADSSFNSHFGLTKKVVAEKYVKGYIPYALKLSKWCLDNGKLDINEELLFSISTLYLECAKQSGVIITELELASDFETEISFAL